MYDFRENRGGSSKKLGNGEFRRVIVPPFEGYVAGEILALHKLVLERCIQQWSGVFGRLPVLSEMCLL